MIPDKLEPFLGAPGPKKRGIYKPKNQLDGFLRFAIGGKYKWRRYEIFKEWLTKGCGYSEEKADEIIAGYQRQGINRDIYGPLLDELHEWKRKCEKDRASKGGKVKAKKYPKWSQARRKKFNLKKLESGT